MKKIQVNHLKLVLAFIAIAGLTVLILGIVLSYVKSKPQDLSAVTQTETDVYSESNESSARQSDQSEETKQTVGVDDWGVDIAVPVSSKSEIKSVRIQGDDLFVQTVGYDQLKDVGYVSDAVFDSCMTSLTRISRIAVSATSDDVNITPWYLSRAMHEAYSKRVGDFYYFAKKDDDFSACEDNVDILHSVVLPLRAERQKIIDALTLKGL